METCNLAQPFTKTMYENENDFIPGSGHGGADEDPSRPVGRAEVLVVDELPRAVHHHARSLRGVPELRNLSGLISSFMVVYVFSHQ